MGQGSEDRALLKRLGVRATSSRLAVLDALASGDGPQSHGDLEQALTARAIDRVTIYRNLNRLVELGVVQVASQHGRLTRYERVDPDMNTTHPHFVCTNCGTVACLPEQPAPALVFKPGWGTSVASATLQLKGHCPACLQP